MVGVAAARPYIVQAVRCCSDLDLHSNAHYSDNRMSSYERAYHQRLFWFCYSLDFVVALNGTPTMMQESDITIVPPVEDELSQLMDSQTAIYVKYYWKQINLMKFLKRIANTVYAKQTERRADEDAVIQIEKDLETWFDALDEEEKLDGVLQSLKEIQAGRRVNDAAIGYRLLINIVSVCRISWFLDFFPCRTFRSYVI